MYSALSSISSALGKTAELKIKRMSSPAVIKKVSSLLHSAELVDIKKGELNIIHVVILSPDENRVPKVITIRQHKIKSGEWYIQKLEVLNLPDSRIPAVGLNKGAASVVGGASLRRLNNKDWVLVLNHKLNPHKNKKRAILNADTIVNT